MSVPENERYCVSVCLSICQKVISKSILRVCLCLPESDIKVDTVCLSVCLSGSVWKKREPKSMSGASVYVFLLMARFAGVVGRVCGGRVPVCLFVCLCVCVC